MTVPVTKDDYWQLTVTPLFAHNHMQRETMRIDPLEEKSNTGVIGRMSDALTGQGLSVGSFSIDHNSISLIGEPGISSTPFIISQNGVTEFSPAPSGANMSQSIKDLNAATEPDSGYFGETWSEKVLASINDNENLYNTLQGTTIGANFPETWLGRKLRTVAQLISTRVERGVDRDMFYVDIGGFDTHSDVRENLINRFTEVNDAIGAFAQELKDMNVWDMVTTVQTSDFARTLAPNTGDGTDHAWGGNYMFFGGSVAGGQVKGTYPEDLTDDGPLGLGRGRLIPKTPWDAVFNGLAEWVGVDAARMLDICPNKNAFPTGDIFSAADLFVPTVRKQRYLRK
uniref:DUF1501 domain-containing protein n=1 Tax=Pseudictyota dubia TaxID=2749911 RepID=A0A7R9WHG4_9STRA